MKTDHDGFAGEADISAARGAVSTQPIERRPMLRSVSDKAIALVPSTGSSPSPFMDIGNRFRALFHEYESVLEDCRQRESYLGKEIDKCCPAEMMMTENDKFVFQFAGVAWDELNDVVGKPFLVDTIEKLEITANLGNMSPGMRERRLELIDACYRWQRDIKKAERRIGYNPERDDKAMDKFVASMDHLVNRAALLRANMPGELAVKAQMALWMSGSRDIEKEMAKAGHTTRIVWSLIRDLLDQSQIYADEVAKTRRGSPVTAMA